jgi:hypothetical protein
VRIADATSGYTPPEWHGPPRAKRPVNIAVQLPSQPAPQIVRPNRFSLAGDVVSNPSTRSRGLFIHLPWGLPMGSLILTLVGRGQARHLGAIGLHHVQARRASAVAAKRDPRTVG